MTDGSFGDKDGNFGGTLGFGIVSVVTVALSKRTRYRFRMGSRWPVRTISPCWLRTVTSSLVKVTSIPCWQNCPTDSNGSVISLNLRQRRASSGNCASLMISAATDRMRPLLAVPTETDWWVGSWASPTYDQGKQFLDAAESTAP